MKKLAIGIIIVLAVSAAAWGQSKPATASQPTTLPFTVGKDTTRITGPLRPDGTVDYVAALNAQASAGITKDNNAAIAFIQILGSQLFRTSDTLYPTATPAEICRALDIEPPAGAPVLDFTFLGKLTEAQARPWGQVEPNPEAVAWIKKNKEALDAFVAATARPRFYFPLVLPSRDAALSLAGPMYGALRFTTRMLAMRANLAISEGRCEDAWSDIQAIYRLAGLLNQDSGLMSRVVAISCGATADATAQRMAASGKLDAKTARLLLDRWPSVKDAPTMIEAFDQSERYELLDTICRLALCPSVESIQKDKRLWEMFTFAFYSPEGRKDHPSEAEFHAWLAELLRNVNWDIALRQANRRLDAMIARTAINDPAERARLWEAGRAELGTIGDNVIGLLPKDASVEQRSRRIADLIWGWETPNISSKDAPAERAAMQRQLTRVALALAVFKTDKGKYPDTLADLTPQYLKDLPKDFFSGGKDFVYKPSADGSGYRLYSVGENGLDDGGKDRDERGDDIVVKTAGK